MTDRHCRVFLFSFFFFFLKPVTFHLKDIFSVFSLDKKLSRAEARRPPHSLVACRLLCGTIQTVSRVYGERACVRPSNYSKLRGGREEALRSPRVRIPSTASSPSPPPPAPPEKEIKRKTNEAARPSSNCCTPSCFNLVRTCGTLYSRHR